MDAAAYVDGSRHSGDITKRLPSLLSLPLMVVLIMPVTAPVLWLGCVCVPTEGVVGKEGKRVGPISARNSTGWGLIGSSDAAIGHPLISAGRGCGALGRVG